MIRSSAMTLLLAGLLFSGCAPAPTPPRPETAGLDPLVQAEIDRALAEVVRRPRDGAAFGELGRVYHANKLFAPAIQAYELAAGLDETSPEWPYYLGLLYSERGREEAAAEQWRRVLTLSPDHAPTHRRLGETRLNLGDPTGAAAAFQEALRLGSDPAAARVGLARAARRVGDDAQAVSQLEQTLAVDPDHREALYLLGSLMIERGRQERGRALLDRFHAAPPAASAPDAYLERLQLAATGVQALLQRADRALAADDRGQAMASYERVLELDPENYSALVNLGSTLMQERKHGRALILLERAVGIDPSQGHGRYLLAMCYLELDDRDNAERELRELLRLDPGHAEATRRLGVLESGGSAP